MSNLLQEMCQRCGACCMGVMEAPVKLSDIGRLMKGFDVSFDEVTRVFVYSTGNEMYLNVDGGRCQALECRDGEYSCHAYEHRPEICRTFVCGIYSDAEDWLSNSPQRLPRSNVFSDCLNMREFLDKVPALLRTNWSDMKRISRGKLKEEAPEIAAALAAVADGREFQACFPSKP